MHTIQDVMTRDVQSIAPTDTVQRAARMMDDLNVGAIPVLDACLAGPVGDGVADPPLRPGTSTRRRSRAGGNPSQSASDIGLGPRLRGDDGLVHGRWRRD